MSESVNPQPIRHRSYYFSNIVVFLVENQLFRVPAHMFESTSPIFRDMFSLTPGPGQEVEGQTDAKPIRLDQVSVVDFERLLRYFYPMGLSSNLKIDMEEWESIFRLAQKWEMTDVHLEAIRHLDKMEIDAHPVLQIGYGIKYNHDPWIYNGFSSLISRADPLTGEEGERLGLKDTIRCAQAREQYVKTGYHFNHGNIDNILKEVFGNDITFLDPIPHPSP